MSTSKSLFLLFGLIASGPISGLAAQNSQLLLDESTAPLKVGPSSENVVYIQRLSEVDATSDSSLHFRAGPISFSNLHFSNDHANYSYPNANGTELSLGCEAVPVRYLGRWGLSFDLGYTAYSASLHDQQSGTNSDMQVTVIPAGLGITYLADYHPKMKWLMPALGAGVAYNIFIQSGTGDLHRARGAGWTLRTSAGLRHSLAWLGLDNSLLSGEYLVNSTPGSSGNDLSSRALLIGFISKL